MTRLPFDPGKLPKRDVGKPARRERARVAGSAAGADEALTVTQVALLIKQTLATRLPPKLKVVGELSNIRDRRHWYLSLKDEENVIDCVMFASAAAKVAFRPEQGQQVVATGHLDFYGPQGRIQLYLDQLEPVGMGALELRFRQLCEELRAAGYFDDRRKKPLPVYPQRLAVVTSRSGAAWQDVIRTARQRWPGIGLCLVDVRVQGADAAPQIARAIAMLSARHERWGVDAVILTRGGGSLEDLWAFNERIVADALRDCRVPVVAAVGHETDTTIAELVADLRCSTPTQAAASLVPDQATEHQHLDQLGRRLRIGLVRHTQHQRARLEAVARHAWFRRPAEYVKRLKREMDQRQRRLGAAARQASRDRRRHVDALARQLAAVSPLRVLERGYSLTTDDEGRILRSAGQVRAGQMIRTRLADGRVDSRVLGAGDEQRAHGQALKQARSASGDPDRGATGRKGKPNRDDGDQPGLFGT